MVLQLRGKEEDTASFGDIFDQFRSVQVMRKIKRQIFE